MCRNPTKHLIFQSLLLLHCPTQPSPPLNYHYPDNFHQYANHPDSRHHSSMLSSSICVILFSPMDYSYIYPTKIVVWMVELVRFCIWVASDVLHISQSSSRITNMTCDMMIGTRRWYALDAKTCSEWIDSTREIVRNVSKYSRQFNGK